MAFGPIIDVPLMSAIYAALLKFKNRLVSLITKIPLPTILLALLTALVTVTIEEHINCGAYGCTNVVLPPTIWFLIFEQLVIFLIIQHYHIKSLIKPLVWYAIFGILFEFIIGAGHAGLQQLMVEQPIIFILLMIWVGFSYIFALTLPLQVFYYGNERNKSSPKT